MNFTTTVHVILHYADSYYFAAYCAMVCQVVLDFDVMSWYTIYCTRLQSVVIVRT